MVDINSIQSITTDMVAAERERFGKKLGINDLPFSCDGRVPSEDVINKAIDLACKDLMVRTLRRRPDVNECEKLCSSKFATFSAKLKSYFTGAPMKDYNEFDNWHNTVCNDDVLPIMESIYKNVAYGKAQKLVNMTFKYLYCFESADDDRYADYFKYCHMPLDSYTMEWIKRIVASTAKKRNDKLVADNIPSWSNLSYGKHTYDDHGKYSYLFFVEKVRSLFSDGNNKPAVTPFQAEFVIWPQIQLKQAAEAFLIQMKSQDEDENTPNDIRKDIRECSLSQNIEAIREAIRKNL
ncbi:MAG: hypothetical protein LUE29_04365 [Lachnospiraceae bacterium]|nr:hypothetical protein [Lachnospiraceae bacterium]